MALAGSINGVMLANQQHLMAGVAAYLYVLYGS
jgi:hypothetical protein